MSTPPLSEGKLSIIALVSTLAIAGVGLASFYTRYPYAENGHNYLAMAYIGACFFLFYGIRLWKPKLLIVAVAVLVGSYAYATKKFDWREDYIKMAEMGQPFALEEYIDAYPTFEQHTFKFLKAPDWVGFNDDCVQPALVGQVIPPKCGGLELIQEHYNIDMMSVMSIHASKMRATAKKIEAGEMQKRTSYAECIARKECATIPLLPKGVDAEKLDPNSQDYIGIRQAFWSLVNDKKMSQQACALNMMCRALVAMKAINSDKIPF